MVKSMNVVSFFGLAAMAVADYGMAPPSSYEPVIPDDSPAVDYPPAPYMPTGIHEEPVPTSTCDEDQPVETDEPYVPEAYTSIWTSCEIVPTVCTDDSGLVYSTSTSSIHYYTSTLETPEEISYPTTITKSFETAIETCITYPTVYTSEGTVCTTETSSYATMTSTYVETNTYTPEQPHYTPPVYTHSVVPPPQHTPYYPTGSAPFPHPPAGTALPTGSVPQPPKNSSTAYVPSEVSVSSASLNGIPMVAALLAVFGAGLLL